MKLRTKYFLSAFTLIVLVLAIVSFFTYYYMSHYLYSIGTETQKIQTVQFRTLAENMLLEKDYVSLLNYIRAVKSTDATIDYVSLIDTANLVLAHTDTALLRSYIKRPDIPQNYKEPFFYRYQSETGKVIIEVSLPVYIGKELVATASIGFLKEKFDEKIQDAISKMLRNLLWAGAFGLFFGVIFSLIFSRMMVSRITILKRGADAVGRGNLDTKIVVKGADEIADLSEHFNMMIKRLKELDELKRDFVSSVTHELRSPIAAIESYINDMMEGGTEQLVKTGYEDLAVIKNNTMRLLRFVNDLLDTAKIDSGRFELNKKKVNLSELINNTVKLYESKAREQKIELETVIEEKIPPVEVDEDRITQVLMNLIGNALKFTTEGGKIIVRANSEQRIANSGGQTAIVGSGKSEVGSRTTPCILVSITDTGIGIPEEEQGAIFDKFVQAKDVRHKIRGAKGTGLGLYIAKHIIELHGGKIWVESPPKNSDRGSAFIFALPLQ